MLTPDYIFHATEAAEEYASQLHKTIMDKIISRMMARIGRGDDYLLTATDKWQIETLQEAGFLLEDIQREIAKTTKKELREIKEAMEDAGVRSLEWDDKIYRAAGLEPVSPLQSPTFVRIMQRNYEATAGEWKNFARTTAEESQRLFIKSLDEAYMKVTTGGVSYTEAVRDVINNLTETGIKVRYPSGYKMQIESATMTIVRTGIVQASAEVSLARAKEMGAEYVLTSSHLGARPTHQVWQGKVFSVDWSKIRI